MAREIPVIAWQRQPHMYVILHRQELRTPVSNLTAHAGPRSVTSSDDAGP
jgi:hypothetical protein